VREDRQRLPFAVSLVDRGEELLAAGRTAEKKHRGLGEGPLEIDVAQGGATLSSFRQVFLIGGVPLIRT
jgi:hypothetical protein